MLALYRSGRQSEALQAYQDVRRVLATEAGLEPGPALRDLERAILHQDVELAPAARPAEHTPRARIRSRRLLYAAAAAAVVIVAGVVGLIASGLTARSSEPTAAGYGNEVVKLSAGGRDVGAPIPVGNSPLSIVLGLGSAWTLNAGDQTISRIDLATQRVVRTFGASSAPTDVAAGYGSLWVLDADEQIDTARPRHRRPCRGDRAAARNGDGRPSGSGTPRTRKRQRLGDQREGDNLTSRPTDERGRRDDRPDRRDCDRGRCRRLVGDRPRRTAARPTERRNRSDRPALEPRHPQDFASPPAPSTTSPSRPAPSGSPTHSWECFGGSTRGRRR